jgi:DNA (cytosine-5)-methyltransferase 1
VIITDSVLADILSISKSNVKSRISKGELTPCLSDGDKHSFTMGKLSTHKVISDMLNSDWKSEMDTNPVRAFKSVELFAGAGGLAKGLGNAGFKHIALNELDKSACSTLKTNIPGSELLENLEDINSKLVDATIDKPLILNNDISKINFKPLKGKVDFLSGGFPCQAFSYAGNKHGFEDTRGTLFFEFARAIKEIQPTIFLGENVKGLLNHEDGKTLDTIKKTIKELGYTLIPPKVLKAIFYRVPQKRERLFLVGIKNEIAERIDLNLFKWPSPCEKIYTLKDGLKVGDLFDTDVPESDGQSYPLRKQQIMKEVPPGGYWRNLPDNLQREYMKGSYILGGGKTGMARRLSWDEPSLTLTTSPAQKQTERCHPEEERPLTYREYARIQTFPDTWKFEGSLTNQYKQIGNAVPVNLAERVGNSLISLFNELETIA